MKFFSSHLEKKSVDFNKPWIKSQAREGACSSNACEISSMTRQTTLL